MARLLDVAEVDVEGDVVAFLAGMLGGGVTVATQVPRSDDFPERMVRVTRSGGVMRGVAHDRPIVLVECWAASTTAARALAGTARAAMLRANDVWGGTGWFSFHAELSGLTNLPDPLQPDRPRYQFAHQLQVRASVNPVEVDH